MTWGARLEKIIIGDVYMSVTCYILYEIGLSGMMGFVRFSVPRLGRGAVIGFIDCGSETVFDWCKVRG